MAPLSYITPSIVAHRAWHQDGAPKNSMAALEAAAANGVDGVEIDIRRLGDGTLVVHHDATMGGIPLDRMDRSTLPTDGSVPTLEQWARRAGELQVNVLAELKEPGYERAVVDTLRRYVADARLEYFSFEQDAVAQLVKQVAGRPVGLLSTLGGDAAAPVTSEAVAQLTSDARRLGAAFVGINHRQSAEPVLQALHGSGLGIKVWPDTPVPETIADVHRLATHRLVQTYVTDRPAEALLARDVAQSANRIVRFDVMGFLRAAATMR